MTLKKLVYLDGQKAALYRSRMNPSLGRNVVAMDTLEWLAHGWWKGWGGSEEPSHR